MSEQRVPHRFIKTTQFGVTMCMLLLGGFWAGAAEDNPLILFDEVHEGERVYSYFDTANPGMPIPMELARVPHSEKSRCIGLFNGVLFVVDEAGVLGGVDLGTGEYLPLNVALPKRHVQKDAMIYIPPGGSESAEFRSLDLRGPFMQTLPVVPEKDPRKPRIPSRDRLRYLTYEPVSDTADIRQVRFELFDFRAPGSAVAEFTITMRQVWRIDDSHSGFYEAPGSGVVYVRPAEHFEAPVVVWTDDDTIALVALAVDFEGMVWEGRTDGGMTLFVMELDSRKGRALPLSTLPPAERISSIESGKGGFGADGLNAYGIDTTTLALLDFNNPQGPGGNTMLSEHFSIVRNNGPMKVLHGGQPLEPDRNADILNAVRDSSGERVLLRSSKGIICYDIYHGYFAEWAAGKFSRFQDRGELNRVEVVPAEGWLPLVTIPIVGGRDGAPAPDRRDRASSYSLVATPSQSTYSEGEIVAVQVVVTNVGTESQWTDVPTPDFPTLSGTLAGSVLASTLARIATLKPVPPTAPVFLEPGGTLSTTLEFKPEAPGAYTLALAYGGNSESAWFGRAKAPLAHFTVGTVGTAEMDADARLRYAILEFIERRREFDDMFFDELRAAGERGEDVLISVLNDMPERLDSTRAGETEDHRYSACLSQLHIYLHNLCSPRLVPYFTELLQSEDRDKKNQGLSAIALLHAKSKKPEFRAELESILREAYADETPRAKAQVANRLRVPLYPELYEELKARADGNDPKLRDEALEVLAREYIGRLDKYPGDAEKYIDIMLSDKRSTIAEHGKYCVEQLYAGKVDLPTLKRVVDEYRVRRPDQFGPNTLAKFNDLWDIPWVRRAAQEPTEARFTLLQRSAEKLESHTGISRAAEFPKTWAEFQQSDVAKAAYETTLKAWEERLQANPAPFKIPVLNN